MTLPFRRTLAARLALETAVLIVVLAGVLVLLWARSNERIYREQTLGGAESLAGAMAHALQNDLEDQNWAAVRFRLVSLARDNPEFVYMMVTDLRRDDAIIVAVPESLQGDYVPSLVPREVTEYALGEAASPRTRETYLLEPALTDAGQRRGQRGEHVAEVSHDIRTGSGRRVGTFRLGISLRPLEAAVKDTVTQAFAVGAAGLLIGLFGALVVARRLTRPIQRLQASASRIAAGELDHRAVSERTDEIGALAESFNNMSGELETSFEKLRRTMLSFERFVPRKFMSVVAPTGIENIEVGTSVVRDVTILFSDIRGYTSISEQLSAQEIFDLLNDYLGEMGEVISSYEGFIDKYIGDAIMALFDAEHTDSALEAALGMEKALSEVNRRCQERGDPEIKIGVGLHHGSVVMGTVGFTSRIDSTVIGDTVNVAARVEGLTKQFGTTVLATGPTVDALLNPSRFNLVRIEEDVHVKGKKEPVPLYRVLPDDT